MPNDPSNPTSTVNREAIGAPKNGDTTSVGHKSGQPEFEQVNGKEANEANPSGGESDTTADEGNETKLDAGTSPTGVGFGKGKL